MMFFLISSISNLRETIYKIPVILGTQSKQNYINSYGKKYSKIKDYSSFSYMNDNLPVNAKVLLWSNHGYYMNRDYIYVIGFITNLADSNKISNPDFVVDELKLHGITHLAMNDNILRRKLKDIILQSDKCNILKNDNDIIIASIE